MMQISRLEKVFLSSLEAFWIHHQMQEHQTGWRRGEEVTICHEFSALQTSGSDEAMSRGPEYVILTENVPGLGRS